MSTLLMSLAGCAGGGGAAVPSLPPGALAAVAARSDGLDAATVANAPDQVLTFYSLDYTDDLATTRALLVKEVDSYFAAFTVVSIGAKQSSRKAVGNHVVEEITETLVDKSKADAMTSTWTVTEEDHWYLENGTWVIRWSQLPPGASIQTGPRRRRYKAREKRP